MNETYSGTGLYRVAVDVSKINKLVSELNDDETRKAIKSGIRKSALIIRKEAQNNLVMSVSDAEFSSTKGGASYKPLKNEINIAVYKNASGARIDLIDKRKRGSRAYMLRWFEGGTEKRTTKKGANRGSIKASYFFSNAAKTKKGEAEDMLEQNIINSIQKVIKKNK